MSVTDEIKERVDLVELISRYTPLKKAGSTYKGNCPFHTERTPSFVVWPTEGRWYCFGACGEGGDAFTFLMRKENLEFREALETLAQETGVELDRPDDDPGRRQRTMLYEINQVAAEQFRALLRTHPAAEGARAYLKSRQIDDETAERFQLGFALDKWSHLREHLTGLGYDIQHQIAAGLLKQNEERSSTYDAFRGRLIIPIRDRQGRVIGFGGRVLDDGVPKYLNTAETPLFHKSGIVYGLDHAYRAIADEDRVVIVEGYMDVIAAHQHGFRNVVACMGTAVTSAQLQQLQRYTKDFVLALDADAAGKQATLRALNQAREALTREAKPRFGAGGRIRMEQRLGARLYITSMPAGRDPDDVIRNDPDDWRRLVAEAPPLVDFYFKIVSNQRDLDTAAGKSAAVSELVALIAELGDDVERQHYVQELSRLVKVDERTIADRVQGAAKTFSATGRSIPHVTRLSEQPVPASQGSPPFEGMDPPAYVDAYKPREVQHRQAQPRLSAEYNKENHLLTNLLVAPSDLLPWLAWATNELDVEKLTTDDLQSGENQVILYQLKGFINSDEPWDPEIFQNGLGEHVHGRYAELMANGANLPDGVTTDELREGTVKVLIDLRLQRLEKQLTHIRFLQDDERNNVDGEEPLNLGSSIGQHVRELSHLQAIKPQIKVLLFKRRQDNVGMKIR